MERVRLGLIGLGLMGAPHARTLSRIPECQLVAASDIDEKQKAVTEEIGIRFYLHYEEMIEKEDLQGVVLALPNPLHAPVGIVCAQKGLHLFVEKPIAQSLSEADRLIEAAKQNGVRILVGHQRRFSSLVEKAREIVAGGELGGLVGVTVTWALLKPASYFEGPLSWRKEKGGGPILINLIHEIDNLRYICGEIDQVFALVSNGVRNFPVEDTAAIALRFRNGALGTIFLSDCTPSLTSWEGTTGENPLLYHDFGNCYEFFGTEGSLLFPQMKRRYYSDPSKVGWNYPITEQGYKVVREDPYVKEFRHFCRVVQGLEEPRISGEDGRRTLEVTLAIQRSGETGQPVQL
ncbi:MAG: Gfo/Idh/MocA family oxidoreductase [Desulfobacterota bacterium]|nr:Gfo/Idh/MocA family oxidoreductase [Thermodesulfobacteriota bacterium]